MRSHAQAQKGLTSPRFAPTCTLSKGAQDHARIKSTDEQCFFGCLGPIHYLRSVYAGLRCVGGSLCGRKCQKRHLGKRLRKFFGQASRLQFSLRKLSDTYKSTSAYAKSLHRLRGTAKHT